jgi:hypothetical protein
MGTTSSGGSATESRARVVTQRRALAVEQIRRSRPAAARAMRRLQRLLRARAARAGAIERQASAALRAVGLLWEAAARAAER